MKILDTIMEQQQPNSMALHPAPPPKKKKVVLNTGGLHMTLSPPTSAEHEHFSSNKVKRASVSALGGVEWVPLTPGQQAPPQPARPHQEMGRLSYLERKFLIAIERGDVATSRRLVESARNSDEVFDINCVDPLGRSALLMAIDNENLEILEFLLSQKEIQTKDALLHAISEQYVEAVELLLDWEDKIHEEGQPHSWEAVPPDAAAFTPDITPLILAAHRDNYEIIKILLDRGSQLPMPHDIKCGCEECVTSRQEDSLRHSRSRINAYRALASPSLIALSSKDPILTAFQLSWELRRLSFLEHEFKSEYQELRRQCMDFAQALLDHTRSSYELEVLLNHNPSGMAPESGERMHLHRLKLAIKYRQKKFVAHPNVQQLLASIWYEGLPGFRRKNLCLQTLEVCRIGIVFPIFCLAYMIAPHSRMGRTMRKPFIKFICNSASYLTFLVLLILASQRIETVIADWFGLQSLKDWISTDVTTKRGAPPTLVEWLILAWVAGLIWSEIKQLWGIGLHDYVMDMWNIIDFITNSLYVATVCLRIVAYFQVQKEIRMKTGTAFNPREEWDTWDPMLIAEGLFAAANIFSSLKLVYIFSINPYLGPLQVSLSRMVMDILKFFLLFVLVLFAFSCGMNQLLWYYADLEKKTCYSPTTKWTPTTLGNHTGIYLSHPALSGQVVDTDACIVWRRFANLFETAQTLFWAAFGLIDLDSFELKGIKSFTRFWGMLMFGCYSTIAIVVLLNLLIAMMNHSYQIISDQADTEWKFARSKLWISYFEEGGTVPPPFNVIPTPKSIYYLMRWIFNRLCGKTNAVKKQYLQTIRRKAKHASDRDSRYQGIMRNLVRRYVTQQQCKADKQGVTEDDVNEIKQDISSFRFELIEILRNSGMKTGNAGGSAVSGMGGKKNKQRERRLMKGMFDNTSSINSKSSVASSLRNTRKKALPPGTKIASPVAALTTSMTVEDEIESDFTHGQYKSLSDKKPVTTTSSAITRMVHLARRVGVQSALTKRRWGTLMEAAKTGSFLRNRSGGEDSKDDGSGGGSGGRRRHQGPRQHPPHHRNGDDGVDADEDEEEEDYDDRKTPASGSDASTSRQDEEMGIKHSKRSSKAHDPRKKRRQWQETRIPGGVGSRAQVAEGVSSARPGRNKERGMDKMNRTDAKRDDDSCWDPLFAEKLQVRRSSSEPVQDAFYKAVIKEGILLDPLSTIKPLSAKSPKGATKSSTKPRKLSVVQQHSSVTSADSGPNFPGSSSHEPLLGSSSSSGAHHSCGGGLTGGPAIVTLGNTPSDSSRTYPMSRKYNGSTVIPQLGIEPADKDMEAGWL